MSRCPRLVTLKNSLAAQHAKSAPCYTPLPSSLPPSFSLGLCMPLPSCHLLRALVTPTRKPQHCQLPKQFSANPSHFPTPYTLPPPLLHFPPALPLANPPLVSCTHRQRCLSEAKRVSTSTYECHNKTIYSATHSPPPLLYTPPLPLSLCAI